MRDLPKVFVNKFDENIRNNKEIYYSKILNNQKKNIVKEIDAIFHSRDFVYKRIVEIVTKDGVRQETIIGKTQGYLLTIDGKKILISEILDIKKL